jgi:hypothetical protein
MPTRCFAGRRVGRNDQKNQQRNNNQARSPSHAYLHERHTLREYLYHFIVHLYHKSVSVFLGDFIEEHLIRNVCVISNFMPSIYTSIFYI